MQLPTRDNTFFSLIEALETFLTNHEQVNGQFFGTDEDIDLEVIDPTELPFVFVGFGNAQFDEGTASIDLELVVADMVVELPVEANRKFQTMTTQFQTLQILRDCVALLKNHDGVDTPVKRFIRRADLSLPVTANPFTAKYKEHMVGWLTTVTITMDNDNDLCLVPTSSE